jgi:serine/threonine protein kinase
MTEKPVCPDVTELEALADGAASGADAARLQRHLNSCSLCRSAYAALTAKTVAMHNSPAKANAAQAGSGYPFLRPPLKPGELGQLGNYRVLRLLGQGGMGLVFQAEDMTLGRSVALKVIRPDHQGQADLWDRFLLEARMLAAIKHDHLVTIYSASEDAGVIFFAMELLRGESLESWMNRETSPPPAEVRRIAREIASGLACLHEHNLVHRDIKPANLWLEGPLRRVKILDLGLVRPIAADTSLTATGIVMGTPDYMAPEQARGDVVDARTDLFSLGCVLYQLCTGKRPFEGRTLSAVLMALASKTPPPPAQCNARVPRTLSELVMKLLEREPENRPASAEVVLRMLAKIDTDGQIQAEEPSIGAPAVRRKPSPAADRHDDDIQKKSGRGMAIVLSLALIGVALLTFVVGIGVFSGLILLRGPAGAKDAPPAVAGEKVFLSDMKDVARENWPFRFGPKKDDKKEWKGPKDGKDFDQRVRVNDKQWPKGIFMHPPHPGEGNEASLTYSLRKEYKTFETKVSIGDTPDRAESPATFYVYGDGKLLWRSNPVWSRADEQACAVSVQGIDRLKLATSCAGPPRGTHAVWLDPVVSK